MRSPSCCDGEAAVVSIDQHLIIFPVFDNFPRPLRPATSASVLNFHTTHNDLAKIDTLDGSADLKTELEARAQASHLLSVFVLERLQPRSASPRLGGLISANGTELVPSAYPGLENTFLYSSHAQS